VSLLWTHLHSDPRPMIGIALVPIERPRDGQVLRQGGLLGRDHPPLPRDGLTQTGLRENDISFHSLRCGYTSQAKRANGSTPDAKPARRSRTAIAHPAPSCSLLPSGSSSPTSSGADSSLRGRALDPGSSSAATLYAPIRGVRSGSCSCSPTGRDDPVSSPGESPQRHRFGPLPRAKGTRKALPTTARASRPRDPTGATAAPNAP